MDINREGIFDHVKAKDTHEKCARGSIGYMYNYIGDCILEIRNILGI
jgi:hypothetical protein